MAELSVPLAAALGAATGTDLAARGTEAAAGFARIDAEVAAIMATIPAGRCRLVTGHESLGYFADAYGCKLIGAVVASMSSTAEPSARQIADLARIIKKEGVPAIFTELGTSPQVVKRLADETGVRVVTLSTHGVPEDGTYGGFVTALATSIAGALTSAP
jgi:zinc/manganese transport system substrate-binding protein